MCTSLPYLLPWSLVINKHQNGIFASIGIALPKWFYWKLELNKTRYTVLTSVPSKMCTIALPGSAKQFPIIYSLTSHEITPTFSSSEVDLTLYSTGRIFSSDNHIYKTQQMKHFNFKNFLMIISSFYFLTFFVFWWEILIFFNGNLTKRTGTV